MKCEEVSRYLSPYLDSELDPKTSFEMSSHFDQCASCHERFESERRIEYSMTVELKKAAPRVDEHWNRAKAAVLRPGGNGRLWGWGLLAVLVVATSFVALHHRPMGGLADDLRNEWMTFEAGRSQLEVTGSDAAPVEAFCRDRLGLALHVPEKIGGLVLEGAKRSSLRGASAAFVSYRSANLHLVVLVFNADHLDRYSSGDQVRAPSLDDSESPHVLALRSGWKVICCISSASADELNSAAKAFIEQ
jgi:anti-sigma factor RsiW